MREVNPYQAPQSDPEKPRDLQQSIGTLYENLRTQYNSALSNFDDVLLAAYKKRDIDLFLSVFKERKLGMLALYIVTVIEQKGSYRKKPRTWKSRDQIMQHKHHIIEEAKSRLPRQSAPAEIYAESLGLHAFDSSTQKDQDLEDAWNFVMGKI